MAFAKFKGNRFKNDGEMAENHAILVNLTWAYRVVAVVFAHPTKYGPQRAQNGRV